MALTNLLGTGQSIRRGLPAPSACRHRPLGSLPPKRSSNPHLVPIQFEPCECVYLGSEGPRDAVQLAVAVPANASVHAGLVSKDRLTPLSGRVLRLRGDQVNLSTGAGVAARQHALGPQSAPREASRRPTHLTRPKSAWPFNWTVSSWILPLRCQFAVG